MAWSEPCVTVQRGGGVRTRLMGRNHNHRVAFSVIVLEFIVTILTYSFLSFSSSFHLSSTSKDFFSF